MDYWNKLNLVQKLFFGIFVVIAIAVLPELAFFVEVGGIELIFGFMVMYLQSIRVWVYSKYQSLKQSIELVIASFLTSNTLKPRVFYLQSTFCFCAFVITGSLSLSVVFFMPGMFITTPLV